MEVRTPATASPTAQEGAVEALATAQNVEVIIYSGDVYSPADERFIRAFEGKKLRENAWLLLTTSGGDPGSVFRDTPSIAASLTTLGS